MIDRIRRLVSEADPEMVLDWKWMGTPTWYHDGVVAIANPFKGKVKVTFSQGANLPDPTKLFNAGLEGNLWRSIDIFEMDTLDEPAFREMVRAAVAFNRGQTAARAGSRPRRPSKPRPKKIAGTRPRRRKGGSRRPV